VSDTADPAKLLYVDVDQLARPGALIADRLLEPDPAQLAKAEPGQIPETVESGILSVSAISAAVIRSPRSLTITASRSGSLRFATRRGAEERSSSCGSPARYLT
jgi:hypothetical protein